MSVVGPTEERSAKLGSLKCQTWGLGWGSAEVHYYLTLKKSWVPSPALKNQINKNICSAKGIPTGWKDNPASELFTGGLSTEDTPDKGSSVDCPENWNPTIRKCVTWFKNGQKRCRHLTKDRQRARGTWDNAHHLFLGKCRLKTQWQVTTLLPNTAEVSAATLRGSQVVSFLLVVLFKTELRASHMLGKGSCMEL